MTDHAFERAVRQHFTNPPQTWTVTKRAAGRWAVIDQDGHTVESAPTRKAAEEARRNGSFVRIWNDRTAWYLGTTSWYLGTTTDPRSRTLTISELRTVADILTELDHPAAPDARHRAWSDAEFCDLCDLVLTGRGRLCPVCDHCATEGCTESLDDGQGFDGYCGNCADRRDHLYD